MFQIRLKVGCLLIGFMSIAGAALGATPIDLTSPAVSRSGFVVLAYRPKGLVVQRPARTPEQDWILANAAMFGGGVAPYIADAFWGARKRSKQLKAIKGIFDGFDHDRFDDRLLSLMRCHVPADRVVTDAPIRRMDFFGKSSSRFLDAHTPGSVLVLQANVEMNPQVDELRFRIDEIVFRFPYRAKSPQELRRMNRAKAAEHRPQVAVINVHEYRYRIGAGGVDYSVVDGRDTLEAQFADGHGPSDTEFRVASGITGEPEYPDTRRMSQIWRADNRALLEEQVDIGLKVLEQSLKKAGGQGCGAG